jgi:predicted dehydrogenase
LAQLAFSVAGHGADLTSRRIFGSNGTITSNSWMGWHDGFVHLRDGGEISSAAQVANYFRNLNDADRGRLFAAGTVSETDHDVSKFDPLRFGVASEIYDFAEAIHTGRAPEVGVADGHKAVALAYSVLEAHACHGLVRVEDVENGLVARWQEPIDQALALT